MIFLDLRGCKFVVLFPLYGSNGNTRITRARKLFESVLHSLIICYFKIRFFFKSLLGGSMRLFFLTILCIQAVFLYAEKPTHLKALVVFDGSGARLQKYYCLDSKRMQQALLGIASQTGLIPEIQVSSISEVTMSKLNSWINSLSPLDVAVFYYVGKETNPRKGRWPHLTFLRIDQLVDCSPAWCLIV